MSPTVAVLGATGKTGRAVVAAALRAGLEVRGTSRRPMERVMSSSPPGDPLAPQLTHSPSVTWHRADIETGEGLAETFSGADAAYLVVPNVHPREVEMVARAARAATEAGVGRLVYHSVADPHDTRMPHHVRKGEAERALRDLRPDAVVLRPCAYQQNLLAAALAGHLEVPYRLTARFSLVDLDDIAEVAGMALAGELPDGGTHVLGGPQELSVHDLADVATHVMGRPVGATSTTVDRWRAGPGAELDESSVQDLLAMFAAYDESGFTVDPAPLTRLLGRPATTWAELLAKEAP